MMGPQWPIIISSFLITGLLMDYKECIIFYPTTHTRFTYHLLWKVHNLISTMYTMTYIVFLYYTSTIIFTFSTVLHTQCTN